MCVLGLVIPSTKMISRKAAVLLPIAVSQWPYPNNSITAGNCQEKLCKTFFNLKVAHSFFVFLKKVNTELQLSASFPIFFLSIKQLLIVLSLSTSRVSSNSHTITAVLYSGL